MTRLSDAAWVVTAAQKESRLAPARVPWGTAHVKELGAMYTACGVPSANWYVFWEHRLGSSSVCRACREVVSGVAGPAR